MRTLVLIVNRLLWFAPTVAGLMVITFTISHVIPADPVAFFAGENATPEQIAELRARYGFDQPMLVQLWNYFLGVLQGDFGVSVYTQRPIAQDLLSRLPATLELTIASVLISAVVGIPLGVLAAVYRNSPLDHALRLITVSGLAIASFWLAILFQLLFAMELRITPLQGRIDGWGPDAVTGFFLIDSALASDWDSFRSAAAHMILPVATLAFPAMATIVRFTRAGVLDAITSNYVLYEQAMGLPSRVIIWKYVLRNALIGTVTQIGLIFGILLAGAVVVEAVFDWPGLGLYAVQSILNSDYNAIMGFTLVTGALFILVNLAVDILHGIIDPRTQGVSGMETLRDILSRLMRDRTAALGAALILGLVLVAIAAPWLATHPDDISEFHPSERLQGPSLEHLMGTDRMGSDIYSRLLYGARITITIAVIAIGVSVAIGVPIGLLAGYYRNWASDALMRVSDIFLAVPQIVLAIAIAQTLGPSLENVILALSLTYWPFWTRLVYAETRSALNETYVEAAVALGASPFRVMAMHVLPNISSSIIVRTTIGMGGTILTAAALGFLGLGPPAPSPEWGRTIAESREFLPDAWWYATAPGIAIFLVVMGFNLLGDGLRDILDPRMRRSRDD